MPQSVACAVAVLYLRLSHETFASDSLEGQEADCIRRARELAGPDAKIVIFREVVSASKAKVRRREFDAMAEYIKENRPAFLIAPALLDAVFLSAGRALHLANAFESKCQYVLRIANLIEAVQADPVLTLQEAIEAAPADKMLGGTLRGLTNHSLGVPSEGVAVLDKARKARNFIAHEGASVGTIWTADRDRILGHAIRLRAAVTDLAFGDNVISLWCHEIDEPKESPPRLLIDAYPKMVDDWVFGHFGGLLDAQGACDEVEPSAGEQNAP